MDELLEELAVAGASRAPDVGEEALGRQGVAASFLGSLEYREDVVRGYYTNLLLRPTLPAQSEVDLWALSSLDITSIRVGFEASVEFYFRVTGFFP